MKTPARYDNAHPGGLVLHHHVDAPRLIRLVTAHSLPERAAYLDVVRRQLLTCIEAGAAVDVDYGYGQKAASAMVGLRR
jgi:hypothetical protein